MICALKSLSDVLISVCLIQIFHHLNLDLIFFNNSSSFVTFDTVLSLLKTLSKNTKASSLFNARNSQNEFALHSLKFVDDL